MRNRSVDRRPHVEAVPAPGRHVTRKPEMIAGIPGHDPDRSAAGIAPEERPLGASEDFDSVDVQENRSPNPRCVRSRRRRRRSRHRVQNWLRNPPARFHE